MRKITLILSLMVAFATTAMAQITSLDNLDSEKQYRIKCADADTYMTIVDFTKTGGNGQNSEGALQFKSKSTDAGQFFYIEKVADTENQYYLKVVKDETTYYVNANQWNLIPETTATTNTPYTIAETATTNVYTFNQNTSNNTGYVGNTNACTDGTKIYCDQSSGKINWSFEEASDSEEETAAIEKQQYAQNTLAPYIESVSNGLGAIALTESMLSSNGKYWYAEGSYANLLDGNTDTYFQTNWYGYNNEGLHYLQIDLGEALSVNEFYLQWTTRPNGSDSPNSINIIASQDGTNWSETLDTKSNMPSNTFATYTSNTITNNSYQYIRFVVTLAQTKIDETNSVYAFGLSEFSLKRPLNDKETAIQTLCNEATAAISDDTKTIDDLKEYYENIYVAVNTPESLNELLTTTKAAANEAVNNHPALNDTQKASVATAISTAETAYSTLNTEITYANTVALIEAINAIIPAVEDVIYVNSLDKLSNNVVYTVSADTRGSWYSDNTNSYLTSTAKASVTASLSDNTQHFAFLKSEAGNYYLYSVSAQKFVVKSEGYNTFSVNPTQSIYFQNGTYDAAYPWVVTFDGGSQIGISNNYTPAVITFWNDLSDQGNNVRLELAATFDPTAVLALIEEYEDRGVYIEALATALSNAASMQSYVGEGLGYYSSSMSNYAETVTAAQTFYNAIDANTAVTDIETETAKVNEVINSFSLNVPAVGKYYMFKSPTAEAYMLSDKYTSNTNRLAMGAYSASAIFYMDSNNGILSYNEGLYLSTAAKSNADWTLLAVGSTVPAAHFDAGTTAGRLGFYIGEDASRAYYSGRGTYVDAGGTIGSGEGYDWVIEEVTTLPVTITSAGWATLCAPVALTIPAGVKAYAVSGISEETSSVAILSEVSGTIPAGVAVVLNGAEGTHDFAITTGGTEPAANLLKGTTAKTQFTKENGKSYYVLAVSGDGASFQNAVNGDDTTTFLNAGHKAYLLLEGATELGSYSFRFEDGATTAIESVEAAGTTGAIYDLTGRRVESTDAPGIYIVNGKKIVVK